MHVLIRLFTCNALLVQAQLPSCTSDTAAARSVPEKAMDPEDHVRFDLTKEEAASPKCSFFGAGDDLKVRLGQIGFGRLADMNSALMALAIST